MLRTTTAAGVALGALVLTGCAAGQGGTDADPATSPTPGVTVTVTATPTAAPTEQTRAPAAQPTSKAPQSAKPTSKAPQSAKPTSKAPRPSSQAPQTKKPKPKPTKAPKVVTVPDVVGMNYQRAQVLLRSRDLIVLPAKDATGEGRFALLDSNWYVVGQKPAAGSRVEVGTPVRASILKYSD